MGTEHRFELIIRDNAWGKVTSGFALEYELNRCEIEKTLAKDARIGRFKGLRELALQYGSICRKQAANENATQNHNLTHPQRVMQYLSANYFALVQVFGETPAFRLLHQFAQEQLQEHLKQKNWPAQPACEIAASLLSEFVPTYIRAKMNESVIIATKKGHDSREGVLEYLNQEITNVRLGWLVESMLNDEETGVRAPKCRKEEIDVILNGSIS